MRKILISAFVALLAISGNAHAITCEEALGMSFVPAQRVALCNSYGPSTLTPAGSFQIQVDGDAQRLFTFDASSDTALTFQFGDSGTTATQVLTVSPSTTDGDDDATLQLGFSAGTRGAGITLPGEEVSGGGDITYNSGASDGHLFNLNGTRVVTFDSSGVDISGGTGNLLLSVAGSGISLQESAAASKCMGSVTFNGTTAVTVSTTCAATGARVFLTPTSDPTGSTAAYCWVTNIVNGTSFDVDCDQANDGTANWIIFKEAA